MSPATVPSVAHSVDDQNQLYVLSTKYSPAPLHGRARKSPPVHPCWAKPAVAVFAGIGLPPSGHYALPNHGRLEAPLPNALPTAPVVTACTPTPPLPMDDGEARGPLVLFIHMERAFLRHLATSGATPTDPVSTYSWNGAIARLTATEPSFHSQASRPPGTFTVKRPSGDTPTLEANEASGK